MKNRLLRTPFSVVLSTRGSERGGSAGASPSRSVRVGWGARMGHPSESQEATERRSDRATKRRSQEAAKRRSDGATGARVCLASPIDRTLLKSSGTRGR